MMFIKATYIDTNEECFINSDYIVDIFVNEQLLELVDGKTYRYVAYTFDNERRGYAIGKDDFIRLLVNG